MATSLYDTFVEPAIVPDIFASGLAYAEDMGDGNFRFTFFTRQRSSYGGYENQVVARIIMPFAAVHQGVSETLRTMGYSVKSKEPLTVQ